MKNWLIASGVAASLALAAVVYAEQGHRGGGPGPGGEPGGGHGGGLQMLLEDEAVVKKLGLTDEQVKAVQEASYEHKKVMVSLRADSELAQLDVKKLMDQDAPNTEALMKALDTEGRLQTEIRKEGVRNQLKIREIIGQDAAKKLREIMRERVGRQGGGEGKGKRGPPGQGGGPGQGGEMRPQE